jgi:hypothetical protein
MIRPVLSALMLAAAPAAAQDLAVPSGQPLELMERRLEDAPAMARFRFLAPELEARGFAAVADDFAALCDGYARPALAADGIAVDRVVISLSAQRVPFGETAPDVTQFFEVFRLSEDGCIWEYF